MAIQNESTSQDILNHSDPALIKTMEMYQAIITQQAFTRAGLFKLSTSNI